MIFHENHQLADDSRRFSRNIIPYICRKLGKMLHNLSSAAVMIGALRVKAPKLFACWVIFQAFVEIC